MKQALRAPSPRQRHSLAGRFFGVLADARAYSSLLYMLLAMITGIPFVVVFFASVRGERMPRRPAYAGRGLPLLKRIQAMFADPRTWSTLFYQLLMLPLGIVYFTVAVRGVGAMHAQLAKRLLGKSG